MTAPPTSRADAEAADAVDELRSFRDQFQLPADTIYLDGNSLGPPSASVLAALAAIQNEWSTSLVTAWDRWLTLPSQVGDALGETLLGASAGQVIVADSTTINLYKIIAAALALQRDRSVAVIETGSFPTDRYVVERLAPTVRVVPLAEVAGALDRDVALVLLSAVDYRTAALADIAGLTRGAHDVGALIVWDLSHAAGVVPLELDAWDVDFAVGCTYKYINAGPGSPAYLYVRRALHDRLTQPIPGWFGHTDQFAMETEYRPADGVARFLTGTPNIPGTTAVAAGVSVLAEAGIDRIRRKSKALTELAIERADALLPSLGFEVASPRVSARRGSHVALRHASAREVCAMLARDHRVITDYRTPDVIRLGFAPLYTRFVDVWDAMQAIERSAKLLGTPTEGGHIVAGLIRKSLDSPEETREFMDGKGKVELVNMESGAVGRATFEPGWRWSEHVKPIAGTDSCQAAHMGYFVSGRMKVVMDNGDEMDYGPGDFGVMAPGHDAWIVGDEPCVVIDWQGFADYAKAK